MKATCHPEREAKKRGLCGACYLQAWRSHKLELFPKQRLPMNASCHPNLPHIAKGLCQNCYRASKRREKGVPPRKYGRKQATCHPNRIAHGTGLCQPCYARENHTRIEPLNWAAWLKRKYSITSEVYDKMCAEQHNLCAICKKPDQRRLSVDHERKTSKIRSLLCANCNRRWVGLIESNPARAQAVLDYLRSWGSIP